MLLETVNDNDRFLIYFMTLFQLQSSFNVETSGKMVTISKRWHEEPQSGQWASRQEWSMVLRNVS